jgi:hypothetical protein
MNLKQFLKPDWRKIVLFAIIFGLLFLFPIIPNYEVFPHPVDVKNFDAGYYVWHSLYSSFPAYENLMAKTGYIIFAIIIPLIFSYILSCLIFWIYDKFRKPRKKQK